MQRGRLDQSGVRCNGVAAFQEDNIARHEQRGRDAAPYTGANDRCLRCCRIAECLDGLFRSRLVRIPHDCVQKDDGRDGQRLVGQPGCAFHKPENCRDGCGGDQEKHQYVSELCQELAPARDGMRRRQPIRSEAPKPRRRLRLTQTTRCVRAQPGEDLLPRHAEGRGRDI